MDGTSVAWRAYDVEVGKFAFRVNWSFGTTLTGLSAAEHTISVETVFRSSSANSPSATVGGTTSSPNHGVLSVVVLNK